ncbi:uncharacterized protein LOC132616523 isoform X1 [Lycium barbarum]|uniref:uncharacterized protein LOC132616523 isoform X1 n=1 Tax=Lycium barbarum TaxID=112863 RepID=UPI00293E35BD|nr:uncharacterized protein LOC132616523 isoform X1 [Lycium barbarum]
MLGGMDEKGKNIYCSAISQPKRAIRVEKESSSPFLMKESAFSTSGRLISSHRSRLHPTTLEVLMCARTWLWNEINGLTSTINKVSCPTLLDKEEEPDSSGLTGL